MHLRDDLEQLRITLAYLLQHSREHVRVLLDHRPVVKLSCKVIQSHPTILPRSPITELARLICWNISWSLRKARGFSPAGAAPPVQEITLLVKSTKGVTNLLRANVYNNINAHGQFKERKGSLQEKHSPPAAGTATGAPPLPPPPPVAGPPPTSI